MTFLVCPNTSFRHYAKLTHGLDHVSKAGMIMQMRKLWFTKGLQCLLKIFAKDVSLVNTHNEARGIKTPLASQPQHPAGHHSWAWKGVNKGCHQRMCGENDMLNYCKEVSCLLSNISVQVKAAQGKVAERFLHEVRPGDFVVIRDHRRKSWKSKRWLEPFQVLLVTHTAVKVAERATWVHVNHEGGCRPLRRRSNRWRRFNTNVNKC